jgi:hypothetical protein
LAAIVQLSALLPPSEPYGCWDECRDDVRGRARVDDLSLTDRFPLSL